MSKPVFELPPISLHQHLSEEMRTLLNAQPAKIRVLAYGGAQVRDEQVERVEDIERFLNKAPVVWIDIEGLGSLEVIEWLQEQFKLHPVHLNSALSPETYPSYTTASHYHVASYPQYLLDGSSHIANLTIYKGVNFLLTVHDDALVPIQQTREFILNNEQASQSKPADYLEYVIASFAMQTYVNLAEHYQQALHTIATNLPQFPQNDYWHIHRQLERLINEFPWVTRDLAEDSPIKPYWDAVDDQMSRLHDVFYMLLEEARRLSAIHEQNVRARQHFFLQIIAGLLGIFLPLILLAIILF